MKPTISRIVASALSTLLELDTMFDTSLNGSPTQRRQAAEQWPAVVTTERLAYRVLAECWHLQHLGHDQRDTDLPSPAQNLQLQASLAAVAAAIRSGRAPHGELSDIPDWLAADVRDLCDALTGQSA